MLTNYLLPMEPHLFLTDGGLETTLVFKHGLELPGFATFDLLKKRAEQTLIQQYYRPYLELAKQYNCGFILEAPTWRASRDLGDQLGYSAAALAVANKVAVELMRELQQEYSAPEMPILISGCVGPREDAYQENMTITATSAREYHAQQIATLAESNVDLITAMTLTNSEEAIGIANAAADASVKCVISFTVETSGLLPTGESLRVAIEKTDTFSRIEPVYYMINCAHPSHFKYALTAEDWVCRIGGVRSNASCKSHAELDNSTELDEGDPVELGRNHMQLADLLPNLRVLGGCCGTSEHHVGEIISQYPLRRSRAEISAQHRVGLQ